MSMWSAMAGPDSSMVDPTELVEITTVGVVKIVSWREDDRGGSGPWKVHVQGGLWSSCRGRVKVSETYWENKGKGLTVCICGSFLQNFIKNIATLTINEIRVHVQLLHSVPGTRVSAKQLQRFTSARKSDRWERTPYPRQ